MQTYSRSVALAAGIAVDFVQDNQSFSRNRNTIRGLHYQRHPHAQAKLVRCVRGSVMDYAVDIRRGSPTYGRYVSAKLTAAGGEQLFVPVGFAHGFITLECDVEIAYKVSEIYASDCEGGIVWNDPEIGIDWGVSERDMVISEKDKNLPQLRDMESPFEYDGYPLKDLSLT